MINDKCMKYVKSEDGMDYYVFTPLLIRQYYNKTEEWTEHRKKLTHKLHMLLYYLRGGYNILYMMDGESIAAYVVYTRCGNTIIGGTTRKDVYTVYVATHPEYRRKGFATKIIHEMLYGIGIQYRNAYKSIADWNIGSQKAAFANGYRVLYTIKKTIVFRRIIESDKTGWKLYSI